MIESKYLTPELKQYYLTDFENICNLSNEEFWDIDNGLDGLLKEMNSIKDIQTLYSKRASIGADFYIELVSYIELAFSMEIEMQLRYILDSFKLIMSDLNIEVEITCYLPRDNPNFNPSSIRNIGCIRNPDYFRLNHFRIEHNSLDINNHDIFWIELTKAVTSCTT